MSQPHPAAGEVIDIRPLGDRLTDTPSLALVRTDELEVLRMVLPEGKSVPEHHLAGGMTVQCLEGTVELQASDRQLVLQAGQLVYVDKDVPYAMRALEDASLLVTLLRKMQESTD